MKKIFTLFAILFTMVGSMMASAGDPYAQRTVAIPSEFNGWYVYVDFYGDDIVSLKSDVESYYEEDKTHLNSALWTQDDYDYCLETFVLQEYIPYYTQSFLGQVVNGEWVVPYGRDERAYPGKNLDPLYLQRYALIFMSNELPIAGTQWAILYSISQADEDFTDLDTHLYARGVMGGNPVTANKDPQSDFYYTTYYDGIHDFKIITPGVEVYTVSINNDYAILNAFTDEIIPANLPVLLKSDASKIIVARDEAWTATANVATIDNALAAPSAYVQNQSYTLAADDNILGFYKCTLGSIPAHTACLNLPADSSAPHRIAFGTNTTTGMQNTAADVKAEKILRNGQLLIKKNGHLYNAQGAVVE